MVGWKVQPYGSVSTLRTTYVHEPPEAVLRESKTPFEVVPWGTRALLRQKIRSPRYTFSAAGVELIPLHTSFFSFKNNRLEHLFESLPHSLLQEAQGYIPA